MDRFIDWLEVASTWAMGIIIGALFLGLIGMIAWSLWQVGLGWLVIVAICIVVICVAFAGSMTLIEYLQERGWVWGRRRS